MAQVVLDRYSALNKSPALNERFNVLFASLTPKIRSFR